MLIADSVSSRGALVLFSGGQDSATCLAWALQRYAHVETVGFDYGQRHSVELQARHLLDLRILGQIGETAMTSERAIEMQDNGLPNTFVPGRNLLFLTLAAALGYRRNLNVLIGGMCETDFSGYPDCRDDTIKSQQVTLGLGLGARVTIETPLMWIDKAQTWQLAADLGGQTLVDLIVEHSHTCYLGERGRQHDWGYGCGECPACTLRRQGWLRWRGA